MMWLGSLPAHLRKLLLHPFGPSGCCWKPQAAPGAVSRGGTCCPSGCAWLPGPAERIVIRTKLFLTGCSLCRTLLRTERAVNPGFGQTVSCGHRGPMAGRGAAWRRADAPPVCLPRREQAALSPLCLFCSTTLLDLELGSCDMAGSSRAPQAARWGEGNPGLGSLPAVPALTAP